jgi:hypothetical protein
MGQNVADVSHSRVVVMAMAVIMVMGMVMIVVVVVVRMLVIVVVVVVVRMLVIMVVVVVVRMVMIMRMIMALFLFTVDCHRHVGTGDATLHGRLGGEFHPGDTQVVHTLHKLLRVGMEFQQGSGEHVSSGAHITFQIQCFHFGILLTRNIVTNG